MRVEMSTVAEEIWKSVPPAAPSPVVVPTPTPPAEAIPYQFVRAHYLGCCGIKELCNIGYIPPKQAIQDFCFQRTAPEILAIDYSGDPVRQAQRTREILNNNKFGCAFVLFTQAYSQDNPDGYGYKLKAYIKNQGLGAVTVAGQERNPNSNNLVTIFIWTINHTALFKWWEKNPISVGHRKSLLIQWESWSQRHQI